MNPMHLTVPFAAALALIACGGKTESTSTPPKPVASVSPIFELGEMTLVEATQGVFKIHADGTTEMADRSGTVERKPGQSASSDRLPVTWKPGPTLHTDGTFLVHGEAVVRVKPDGSVVNLKTGDAEPLVVIDDTLTVTDHGERHVVKLATDGALTLVGGQGRAAEVLHVDGAETAGKRRAVLAMVGLALMVRRTPTAQNGAVASTGNVTIGGVNLPTTKRALEALPTDRPVIVVNTPEVVADGKPLFQIKDGDVVASEKDGGAPGMAVPRLTKFITALLASTKPAPSGFVVAIDHTLTYKVFTEIVFSMTRAGVTTFGVAGKQGSSIGVIPLAMPSLPQPPSPAGAPAGALTSVKVVGMGLAVSATKDKLVVWSISGSEGTLKAPKASVARTDLAAVSAALSEIAKRRWGTKQRGDADRTILLMADSSTSMQDVFDLMIAIRTTEDGKELFPNVLLSAGFE